MSRSTINRRHLLRLGAGSAGGWALSYLLPGARAHAQSAAEARFLFVATAAGGGSITDSFLPVAQSEVSSPELAATVPVYPDSLLAQPPGSRIRCVRNLKDQYRGVPFGSDYEIADFVTRYRDDMLVRTVENTSVSHLVAQHRAMTGDNVDGGRTIAEAAAMVYGGNLPLPNCIMATGGFGDAGASAEVPDRARSVRIDDPNRFALSTHSSRGVVGAPPENELRRAKKGRSRLETRSPFSRQYPHSAARKRFLDLREGASAEIEAAGLIDKLLLLQNTPETPLHDLGLMPSPLLEQMLAVFPSLGQDPLDAQAALAFVLARFGISRSVTFGPSFIPEIDRNRAGVFGTPLAFDYSHTNHLIGQNVMWCRLMRAIDGLITLLKNQRHGDGSMWDRSLIYVATDFGRTKEIPAGGNLFNYSSGHGLNNGNLLISPRLRGNRVYGGIVADTCKTYGFEPKTGDPEPGRLMSTGHLYSLICQALDIDFPGRYDMSGLVRA